MSNTKIIVCYHKPFEIFESDVLLPLHVGKARSKTEISNISKDNTGDNISDRNDSFCELTGLYWLWKNVEADNYGLLHYRRFLDIHNKYPKEIYPSLITKKDWSSQVFDELMSEYDIILPKKSKFKISVHKRYWKDHIGKDLDIILNIIRRDYPQYIPALDKSMKENAEYCCNIFVMRKNLFYEYCQWLFDILFKAEKEIDITNYDSYQHRVFGFLSERMMNIFIQYKLDTTKDFKIKHVKPVMVNPEPIFRINLGFIEFINYPNKIYLNLFGIKLTKNKRDKK